jgi:plastocyanin domain-containing protein
MKSRFFTTAAALLVSLILVSCGQKPAQQAAATPEGAIQITVGENGFEPSVVTVHRGELVTLVVTRKTEKTCATEFVMKEHNINQPLPLNQAVTITFTPDKTGDLGYACAMDMYRGTIRVE